MEAQQASEEHNQQQQQREAAAAAALLGSRAGSSGANANPVDIDGIRTPSPALAPTYAQVKREHTEDSPTIDPQDTPTLPSATMHRRLDTAGQILHVPRPQAAAATPATATGLDIHSSPENLAGHQQQLQAQQQIQQQQQQQQQYYLWLQWQNQQQLLAQAQQQAQAFTGTKVPPGLATPQLQATQLQLEPAPTPGVATSAAAAATATPSAGWAAPAAVPQRNMTGAEDDSMNDSGGDRRVELSTEVQREDILGHPSDSRHQQTVEERLRALEDAVIQIAQENKLLWQGLTFARTAITAIERIHQQGAFAIVPDGWQKSPRTWHDQMRAALDEILEKRVAVRLISDKFLYMVVVNDSRNRTNCITHATNILKQYSAPGRTVAYIAGGTQAERQPAKWAYAALQTAADMKNFNLRGETIKTCWPDPIKLRYDFEVAIGATGTIVVQGRLSKYKEELLEIEVAAAAFRHGTLSAEEIITAMGDTSYLASLYPRQLKVTPARGGTIRTSIRPAKGNGKDGDDTQTGAAKPPPKSGRKGKGRDHGKDGGGDDGKGSAHSSKGYDSQRKGHHKAGGRTGAGDDTWGRDDWSGGKRAGSGKTGLKGLRFEGAWRDGSAP